MCGTAALGERGKTRKSELGDGKRCRKLCGPEKEVKRAQAAWNGDDHDSF